MESERELDTLKHELVTQNFNNSSGLKDLERRLRKWEWKSHLLTKMKSNYEQAGECAWVHCSVCLYCNNRTLAAAVRAWIITETVIAHSLEYKLERLEEMVCVFGLVCVRAFCVFVI